MINILHLFWIVPLSGGMGVMITAFMVAARTANSYHYTNSEMKH